MIRLRHLRLRSITVSRAYGVDIAFCSGLNIIQAPNTSGKSTCLQAIIYALGLERSLGPQLTIPLPYAMRERVHESKDTPYENVLQSYVELEIGNERGSVLVLHRDVVGGKNTKLIQTWNAPLLSERASGGIQRDFYVLDRGSATRESGFHAFLVDFVGWELPIVARFDGTECPLYLEAIFPMLFVEQKRGWSAIQGPFPTYLRIQDVTRRVMEFLLDLETARNRRRRAELRGLIADYRRRWTAQRQSLEERASGFGRVRGVPQQPTAEFAISPAIELELFYEGDWVRLTDVANLLSARIGELEATQLATVEDAAPAIEARISELKSGIDELSAEIEVIRSQHAAEFQDVRALKTRVKSLEIDLERNQDAQKLQRLGSELGRAASEHVCPTCHQTVSSELLPAVENVGMALEENITFVKSQIELYRAALSNAQASLQGKAARYRGTERDLRDKQQEIRALRQELIRPASSPSRAAIEEIVRLQAFVDRLRSVDELAMSLTDELRDSAASWASATDGLKCLPPDELTSADKAKANELERRVRAHLELYGFRSFQPAEISLSRDNFRPLVMERDETGEQVEKEINFEVSASDAIRLKWAYYLSLLELKESYETNHPGLLVFDEPGQQEIEPASLFAFLDSAAHRRDRNRQVIVSTSESFEAISEKLAGQANVVNFPGFILQPQTGR